MEATAMTVSSFVAAVGTVFTAAVTWLGEVGQAIAADGILTTFVCISLVGLGVGLYRRMINIG